MRARLARELPPEGGWDVKHRPGGQMEVEFVAQTLQLVHARERPEVCSQTTRIALARLAAADVLPEGDARLLIRADHLWRTVQGMLRITAGRNAPENLPEASMRPLLEATGAVDLGSLRATIDATAREVRAAFVRHVGEIGT
jgi:glutamate-ammonia-ligase adenylyltransferase